MIVAFSALGLTSYLTYICLAASDEGRAWDTKPIGRINQIALWIKAVGIIAFALFPLYTGYLVSALCYSESSNQSCISSKCIAQSKTVIIEVEGTTCKGCAAHIDETLQKLQDVHSSKASYKNKNVKVEYDPDQIIFDKIKKVINDIGYVTK